METGLYRNTKRLFRKAIGFLKSRFRHTDPNRISLSILPIGAATAFTYFYAPEHPLLYWVGVALIVVRLVASTLDGLIAETQDKETPRGAILNRLIPEAADLMLMTTLVLASSSAEGLGLLALTACWGVSFTGLVGLLGEKPVQDMGPAGPTDRLVVLLVASLLQFFSLWCGWGFDFIQLFLTWVVVGGIITICLRCHQILECDD